MLLPCAVVQATAQSTWKGVAVHGAHELIACDGGVVPCRLPETVRAGINDVAARMSFQPAGVELRFVADGPVRLRLSTPESDPSEQTDLTLFQGPFQMWTEGWMPSNRRRLGPEPTWFEIKPQKLPPMLPSETGLAWSSRLLRVLLPPRTKRVVLHDIEAEPGVSMRLPDAAELPDRRVLFYGTSITHGSGPSAPHLTIPALTGGMLGVDTINLGFAASAHVEPAIAHHIANRGDWDAAVLELSVNLIDHDESIFAERVEHMLGVVSAVGKPVLAVGLFPFRVDFGFNDQGQPCPEKTARAQRFRTILRETARRFDGVTFVDGRDLTKLAGLTTDLIHPGDQAAFSIARGLADRLAPMLDSTR